MAKKNQSIATAHHESKTFSFEKNGLKLDFSLFVDNKNSLLTYKEILEVAAQYLGKEVEARFPSKK